MQNALLFEWAPRAPTRGLSMHTLPRAPAASLLQENARSTTDNLETNWGGFTSNIPRDYSPKDDMKKSRNNLGCNLLQVDPLSRYLFPAHVYTHPCTTTITERLQQEKRHAVCTADSPISIYLGGRQATGAHALKPWRGVPPFPKPFRRRTDGHENVGERGGWGGEDEAISWVIPGNKLQAAPYAFFCDRFELLR